MDRPSATKDQGIQGILQTNTMTIYDHGENPYGLPKLSHKDVFQGVQRTTKLLVEFVDLNR